MPLDPKLNSQYFMKNRDRLLKFIAFVKSNPDIRDVDLESTSIQKKITRKGLGLRDSYTVSSIACLPNFVKTSGGIDYFRTKSLVLIAGHRALAAYVALDKKQNEYIPGKCPFYKCSLVSAGKLYRQIFGICENDVVPKENVLAMQHVLQCKNYCQDYFDLKEKGFEQTWSDEELMTRVREFILQQVLILKQADDNVQNQSGNVGIIDGGKTCEKPHSSGVVDTPLHKSISSESPLKISSSVQCVLTDKCKDKFSEMIDEKPIESPTLVDDVDGEAYNYPRIEVKEKDAVELDGEDLDDSMRDMFAEFYEDDERLFENKADAGMNDEAVSIITRKSSRAHKIPKKFDCYQLY